MVLLSVMGEAALQAPNGRLSQSAARVFSLALVLLLDRERPRERDELVALVWPDAEQSNGRHNLRQALYRLRMLGISVRADGERIVVASGTRVQTDEPLMSEVSDSLVDAILSGTRKVGPFLGGYDPRFSPAMREWVDDQREQAHARLRGVLVKCLEHLRRQARWSAVDQMASLLLQFDPFNEVATLARAEVAALTGDKVGAVRMLERYAEEVGRAKAELTLPSNLLRRRVSESLLPLTKSSQRHIPLVGRQPEVSQIMQTLTELSSEQEPHRTFAFLTQAPPGFGKTRLLEEANYLAGLLGIRVAHVTGLGSQDGQPLAGMLLLCRQLLELPGALGCDPESLALLRDLSDGTPTIASDDDRPLKRSAQAFSAALLELLRSVTAEIPLLILIDDIQWLSDQCSSTITRCIRDTVVTRCCFIASSRYAPPHRSHWSEVRWDSVLHLQELSEIDSRTLARFVLLDESSQEREDWIVGTGGGNPLFLRLLADSVVDTQRIEIPRTLSAAIYNRLHLCSPDTLRLLQTVALATPYSDIVTVRDVTGLSTSDLRVSVDEAERLGLLTWSAGCLHIHHQLITDALIKTCGDASKALIHRAIAVALEAPLRTRATITLAWHCAHHWMRAGEYDRAVAATQQCTSMLTYAGFPDEAIDIACRVLENSTSEKARQTIIHSLLEALDGAGRWTDVARISEGLANTSSQVVADKCTLASLHATFRIAGDANEALPVLMAMASDKRRSAELRIEAAEFGLRVAGIHGAEAESRRLFSSVEPLLRINRSHWASLSCDVIFNTAYGDLESARCSADELVALSEQGSEYISVSRALRFRATVLERLGRLNDAKLDLLRSWHINSGTQSRFIHTVTAMRLLQLSLDAAWDAEAGDYFRELAPATSLENDPLTKAGSQLLSARYLFSVGETERATLLLDSLCPETLGKQPLRHSAGYYAMMGLAAAHRADNEACSSALKSLLRACELLKGAGGFDFCAAIQCILSTRLSGAVAGDVGWQSYLSSRRESGPVGAGVLRLLTLFNVTTHH